VKKESYSADETKARFDKLLQTAVTMKPQPVTSKKKGKPKASPSPRRK